MAVTVPAGAGEIDFHIATARRFGAELHNGTPEVGAALAIPEARVQNPDSAAIDGAEGIASQTLVKPDGLELALGRYFCIPFTQRKRSHARPPVGIKGWRRRAHVSQTRTQSAGGLPATHKFRVP